MTDTYAVKSTGVLFDHAGFGVRRRETTFAVICSKVIALTSCYRKPSRTSSRRRYRAGSSKKQSKRLILKDKGRGVLDLSHLRRTAAGCEAMW